MIRGFLDELNSFSSENSLINKVYNNLCACRLVLAFKVENSKTCHVLAIYLLVSCEI